MCLTSSSTTLMIAGPSDFGEITQNNGHHAVRGDFGTNGKLVCDFLLVNNNNLHPVSRRFQDIAKYWSDSRCRHRGDTL